MYYKQPPKDKLIFKTIMQGEEIFIEEKEIFPKS